MNDMLRNIILWVVIAVVLVAVFNNFSSRKPVDVNHMAYSQFIAAVNDAQVKQVSIEGQTINGVLATGEKFSTYTPDDPHMVDDLLKNHVEVRVLPPEQPSLLMQILISWFPMLLFIGVWIFFIRQMQGGAGGRGAMSFGKSKEIGRASCRERV